MLLTVIIIYTSREASFARPLLHPIHPYNVLPSHSYIPAHMHAIRCCKQGCERTDLAHMKSSKEREKGTDYVNSTHLMYNNLWRMRIYFILFGARDLSNQQAKKLVSLLALSLARPVKARNQKQNLLPL